MRELFDCPTTMIVFGMANVESRSDLACNNIRCARLRFDGSHGRHKIGNALCGAFDSDDPLGGTSHGIEAEVHGSSTSVIGATGEHEIHAGLSGDSFNDAEWRGEIFEHG